MLKVPVAASTVSVSVYNTESAYGIAKLMESLGGVVGFVTAPAGETMNPILRIPSFCTAITWTGRFRPVEATAPGVGAIRTTRRAEMFDRTIHRVSSAKLPFPSIARPTICTSPPAPEPTGKVTIFGIVSDFTVVLKVVSAGPAT